MSETEKKVQRRMFLYDYFYEGGMSRINRILAARQKQQAIAAEDPDRKALREYLYSPQMLNEIVVILPKESQKQI